LKQQVISLGYYVFYYYELAEKKMHSPELVKPILRAMPDPCLLIKTMKIHLRKGFEVHEFVLSEYGNKLIKPFYCGDL
jgi:hypothetical protein